MYKIKQPFAPGTSLTLLSDLHVGCSTTDYDLLQSHIECADRFVLGGDLIDAIFPRDHKRYDPTDIHPRIQNRDDLLSAQIDWVEELFDGATVEAVGQGNHETSALRHHYVDSAKEIANRLNAGELGYTDVIRVKCGKKTYDIAYWHGHGGGSARGGCVGMLEKFSTVVRGADVYWTGHRHQRLIVAMPYRDVKGKIQDCYGVMTGSYVPESRYAVERMYQLGGLGGARVTFYEDGLEVTLL